MLSLRICAAADARLHLRSAYTPQDALPEQLLKHFAEKACITLNTASAG